MNEQHSRKLMEPKNKNSPSLEETLRGDFLKKQELITLLLSCPSIANRASRDNLIREVHNGRLIAKFARNEVNKIDVQNIVNTLLDYSGALEELISFMRMEDSGTQALQALETFQNVLMPLPISGSSGLRPSLSPSGRSFKKDVPATNLLEKHFNDVMDALVKGKLVIFLGSEINCCGREPLDEWVPCSSLPAGYELAGYLARNFGYSLKDPSDLAQVSQLIDVDKGYGNLYEELHRLFDYDYIPNPVHNFFASLPTALKEKGFSPRPLLFVTSNYDDVLEQAFRKAGLDYDVVSYVAEDNDRGKFRYRPCGADGSEVIERPNEADEISLEERSVILKTHGMVDRDESDLDSFAITEDHLIGYLARAELSNLIPYKLLNKLRNSPCLFLGYNLRNWNTRVLFNRLWQDKRFDKYNSWAVELEPQELDRKFWMKRNVDLREKPLEEYLDRLGAYLEALPGQKEQPL
ncbi:MAG: SIR2 family protein [Chloroflexi bacterium]|nr:SIR2 family protein [Chloroflexota bacterium]